MSGDAAHIKHAPKNKQKVSTCVMQLLSFGVYWSGSKLVGVVKGMVRLPQSCKRCFPLRLWFDDDGSANVRSPSH